MMHRRSAALALALGFFAQSPCAAGGNAKIIAARMTLPGIMKVFAKGSSFVVAIPLTYVFDANGGQVAVINGYGPETKSRIERALSQTAPAGAPQISGIIEFLVREDAKPMSLTDVPPKTAVIASLGAEWCAPCRYLKPEIEKIVAESKAPVVALDIDADVRRLSREKLRDAEKGKQ